MPTTQAVAEIDPGFDLLATAALDDGFDPEQIHLGRGTGIVYQDAPDQYVLAIEESDGLWVEGPISAELAEDGIGVGKAAIDMLHNAAVHRRENPEPGDPTRPAK